MPVDPSRTRTRPRSGAPHAAPPRPSAGRFRVATAAVVVVAISATAAGCGRPAPPATDAAPPPAPAVTEPAAPASAVAASATTTRRRDTHGPGATPAAAIVYGRDGDAIAVQNFTAGRVPSAEDGAIWTCRYFAIESSSGSTFGLGPDLDHGPVTPAPGDLVWISCPSGHDEYLAFDPARPFGTWSP